MKKGTVLTLPDTKSSLPAAMRAASAIPRRTDCSSVSRALYRKPWPVQHMGVNHGGGHIGMAAQFLDRADVVVGLEKVGGERVAQRVGNGVCSKAVNA